MTSEDPGADAVLPRHPFDASLGDGWVEIGDGRRFWGRFGAAGLLLRDPSGRVLLQHRVSWSHFGDTWGLPGGARHPEETAFEAALRESEEEAGVPADLIRPVLSSVVVIGPWSYSTVLAESREHFTPRISDAESTELRWVAPDEVDSLPLHPGFGAAWPGLRALGSSIPVLVVDAANVVGSRPDGWWRDRAGAAERLLASLARLAEAGVPGRLLGIDADTVWPRIAVVLEGVARAARPEPGALTERLTVHSADGSGDDAIVELVGALETAVVVTADRGLAARVEALGAAVVGPRSLLDLLDPARE
ncbi:MULTISPECIES: NUDIX domain-containing protein [unclassified Rathayibacter]|jgi:8-oxo-dGTP pyrophosphatase MutT (NUDIX family)|uniref:NUDIX domain-containing protein n=1 Tax=unclassified Rathayibacter TaxID=2609250 RepID=UPI000CE8820A|nr:MULTISPECIES: NUDIX domain-containing protein [unclassified Rathayibacter]PPF50189.1 NTP pyrophosphohydrolase [Rathayibacter sp. AY1A1]PPG83839.1 NTP pyrophosphohydrolase [Rathayibacter sp. AY1H2]PPH01379.1 NTP pyrophosphohydrolase [Rathayibacter sp. AY1G9]